MKQLYDGRTRAVMVLTQGQTGQLQGVEVTCAIGETAISSVINLELGHYFSDYSKRVSTQQMAAILSNKGQISAETASAQAEQLLFSVKTVMLTDAWMRLRYFDFYASAIVIIVAIGLPMLISSISITSERAKGTIERIFISPYKKSEIILGKVLANSILAIMFAVLFVVILKVVFNMALGDIWLVLLLAILVGINGTVLGLLISSITYSEAESVIIGILVMLGMMTMITYLMPWETMHPVIKVISHIIPFTYGIQAIRQVNMVGLGLAEVWPDLVILLVSIIVLTLIAIPALRREVR
jgi:ABC-2 type transport system permease protein